MKHTIGIDAHGKGIHHQIENDEGQLIGRGQVSKNYAGWLELLERLSALEVDMSKTAVFIEATGRHHLAWCERLHVEGCAVYQINPWVTKRLHSAANAIRDNNTDKIDAAAICEVGRLYRKDLERFARRDKRRNSGFKLWFQHGGLCVSNAPICSKPPAICSTRSSRTRCAPLAAAGADSGPVEPAAVGDASRSCRRKKRRQLHEAIRNSFTPEELAQHCSWALVQLIENIERAHEGISNFDHQIGRALLKYETPGTTGECRTESR